MFNLLCSRWVQPQVDLFETRFNHKLPKFVSPVPDQTVLAVDALSLPWENLDVYAFPPVALLSKVVSKVIDHAGLSKNDSDCAGLAQYALVLGPGQSVSSDSGHASPATRSGDTAIQQSSPPRSQEPKPVCLAP